MRVASWSVAAMVTTVPDRPCRPTRPARCKYWRAESGTLRLKACDRPGRSKPRESMSVLSKTLACFTTTVTQASQVPCASNVPDPTGSSSTPALDLCCAWDRPAPQLARFSDAERHPQPEQMPRCTRTPLSNTLNTAQRTRVRTTRQTQ